jgi:hypothetical protein
MRRLGPNSTDDQGPWPLNEAAPLSVALWLMVGTTDASGHDDRRLPAAFELENPPIVMYTRFRCKSRLECKSRSPLRGDGLPYGIEALTFRARAPLDFEPHVPASELILRVQNVIEGGADRYAHSLSEIFESSFTVCTEATLSVQQNRSDSTPTFVLPAVYQDPRCSGAVKLTPLDIRTFVIRTAT